MQKESAEEMIKKVMESSRSQRRFSDLVGIDFSTTSTKVVRLKKSKGDISLVGIDLLPALDFGSPSGRLELPRNMCAYYGCFAYSGPSAVARMVNSPLEAEREALSEAKLRELLNVEDNFRVGASLVKRGKGRQDSSFLAAAIPQADIQFLLDTFPSGSPAPASIEVAGLSCVSAFLNARGDSVSNEAVCLLESGESASHFVFLNQGQVTLVGKLSFGARMIREKVAVDLGVDDELAATILNDRSINISSSLDSVIAPFLKQLSISKDFIERHQGCRVTKVFVSGGLSLLPNWSNEVGRMLNAEAMQWSPFENIQYDSDVIPDFIDKQATRFSAAIGAAIGGFEES
jgi:Tfp pilus assembly PilM family ATPase